jgi:LysM repeat protein
MPIAPSAWVESPRPCAATLVDNGGMVLNVNEPTPQPRSHGDHHAESTPPTGQPSGPPGELPVAAGRDGRWVAVMSAFVAVSAVLAGCAAPVPPPAPEPPPPPPVAAPEPPPVAAPEPPAEAPAPAEPAPEVSAVPVQRLVSSALELLEAGNEEQASAELQRALQQDPNHRLAQNLLKQITSDPVALLGRESFAYRVQPGETLSRIAQRHLGDLYQFYILARYNDIKVPRQLAGGQVIRLPGKAPPPGAAPAQARTPPAAPAAAPVVPVAQPAAPPAATAAAPAAAPAVEPAREAPRADAPADRSQAILRATRAARAALARQDLAGAIRHWDTVLELDPGNNTARLERQKVRDLRDRLNRVK